MSPRHPAQEHELPVRTAAGTEGRLAWCCVCIAFCGAFLLFQVQPLMSKMMLPWFGGSPAVWTTCMLFFQVLLIGGYAYADWLSRHVGSRQLYVHGSLLLLACVTLPITRAEMLRPVESGRPIVTILTLLSVTVGLPYLMLSTTGPLIQHWYARIYPTRSPYRLYSVSNLGSLLALLSYPMVMEPNLSVHRQALLWSGLFVGYAALTMLLVKATAGYKNHAPTVSRDEAVTHPISVKQWSIWLLLPALGSMMMLATTNQLCQNVAVIPLLWVVPLSVYLCSFIICFDNPRWYHPTWYSLGVLVSIVLASKLLLADQFTSTTWYFEPLPVRWIARSQEVQIGMYMSMLFMVCMLCHGEAARHKPAPAQLTKFYLCVAVGGALGGLYVSILAPLLFTTYFELNLGLALSFLVALTVLGRRGWRSWLRRPTIRVAFCAVMTIALVTVGGAQFATGRGDWLDAKRNFYGVITVTEEHRGRPHHARTMLSGTASNGSITEHGKQYLHQARRREPTLYYTFPGGAGLVLRQFMPAGERTIGVIGLGVGTVVAHGMESDHFRFYEINALVRDMAREYFTYLEDAVAETVIVIDDGRAALEREPPQRFHVLIVDAFTGDTIPTHLLTREAFDLYLNKHLAPEGVLAVHVSNRYLDLVPIVARQANFFQTECLLVSDPKFTGDEYGAAASEWLLLTRNQAFLEDPVVAANSKPISNDTAPVWTDQRNNVFALLLQGKTRRHDESRTEAP